MAQAPTVSAHGRPATRGALVALVARAQAADANVGRAVICSVVVLAAEVATEADRLAARLARGAAQKPARPAGRRADALPARRLGDVLRRLVVTVRAVCGAHAGIESVLPVVPVVLLVAVRLVLQAGARLDGPHSVSGGAGRRVDAKKTSVNERGVNDLHRRAGGVGHALSLSESGTPEPAAVWQPMDNPLHHTHMELALQEAAAALAANEVPVGCVFVHPSAGIIGRGHNNTVASCNGTRHAEMEAIDRMLLCVCSPPNTALGRFWPP